MSEELNCMNCCIGHFRELLCDCDGEFCQKFKGIGSAIDFERKVMSAQERKKGEWVSRDGIDYECSQCGLVLDDWAEGIFYRYCPNCGCWMKGEQNE